MVKLWGGYAEDLRLYPGGMFTKHIFGRKRAKAYLKCPKPFDVQRLFIARHLLDLHNPNVYMAKKVDLEFEKKVEEHKKLLHKDFKTVFGVFQKLRRKRNAALNEDDEDEEELESCGLPNKPKTVDQAYLEHGKYDFSLLTFKSLPENAEQRLAKRPDVLEERRIWLTRFVKDVVSDAVLEITSNYRMVVVEGEAFYEQSPYITYQEFARYALKEHKWKELSFSLCGMAKEIADHPHSSLLAGQKTAFTLPCLWTYGFLAVVNHFKDDVEMCKQFARQARTLFYSKFPLYIGSHIAVWLIQKGYFMEAYELLDEEFSIEPDKVDQFYHYRRRNRRVYDRKNPKRDQGIFVYDLIRATYLYVMWKKEQSVLLDTDDDYSTRLEDSVRRNGEQVLTAYLDLYELHKELGADAMIFMKPLIELLVEYRSVDRAYHLLQEMWVENDGNMYFEKFFVEFLEKYADLIEFNAAHRKIRQNVTEKFVCTAGRDAILLGRKKINKVRKRRIKENIQHPNFEQMPLPGFSI